MIVTVPIFLTDNVIDTKVEIQIRTIAMDFWASLEHKIYYKFEGNAPANIKKDLKECADIIGYLDHKMMSLNSEIQSYTKNSLNDYKEIMSQNYLNCMKESYGKIVEDDEEEGKKKTEESSGGNATPKGVSSTVSDFGEQVKKIFRKKQA